MDRQAAARLENAQYLPEIVRRIGPVVVRLDGSRQIEVAITERKGRHRRLMNLDRVSGDRLCVPRPRRGDARRRVVDAVDGALDRHCRQALDCSAAAAADVEDRELRRH
jgi:hypothetical protein